jgi:hypothetical protein
MSCAGSAMAGPRAAIGRDVVSWGLDPVPVACMAGGPVRVRIKKARIGNIRLSK